MLFITHDLGLALTIADRVAVFYAGETIEEALAADFEDPDRLRHPFTKALFRAMPAHGFAPIQGSQPYPGTVSSGCPFAGQCQACQEACVSTEHIPVRQIRGGLVRCLYPEEGNV